MGSNNNGFLQSEQWRKFQETTGKNTFSISEDGLKANIFEHSLPIVGKYFYIPRGPIFLANAEEIPNPKSEIRNKSKVQSPKLKILFSKLINLARENNINWIRIEPRDKRILELIQGLKQGFKICKAPHDMQPREIFVINITKSEGELLAEMKSKTRYNIRLAEKKSVIVTSEQGSINSNYVDEFIRLNKITAKRDRITTHPESYYRKMLEIIPEENIKLYIAEYKGSVVAANIIVFYGNTATYLHGASDNEYRNVMAPYLLQWQAIMDAKEMGYKKYDFGGIKTGIMNHKSGIKNNWQGITRFKAGFSPSTKPTEFPGSYDIVLNSGKYNLYRFLQKIKSLL